MARRECARMCAVTAAKRSNCIEPARARARARAASWEICRTWKECGKFVVKFMLYRAACRKVGFSGAAPISLSDIAQRLMRAARVTISKNRSRPCEADAAKGVRFKPGEVYGDIILPPQRTDFLQTLRAVGGFLDRAIIHCSETGTDPDDFVNARLFEDMAPFHFKIEASWHHSVWGLEASLGWAGPLRQSSRPDRRGPQSIESAGPRRGQPLPSRRRLSSSHFHCPTSISTRSPPTTYSARGGLPLGKRDYEGRLRTRSD